MNEIKKLNINSVFTKYNSLCVTRPKDYGISTNSQLVNKLKLSADSSRRLYWDFSSAYSSELTFCDITPEEFYDIEKSRSKILTLPANITPVNKNKIFFYNSTFPSLLLGRLGTNLNRTTKADTADIIVSDCNITTRDVFHEAGLFDFTNKIYFGNIRVDSGVSKTAFVDNINKIINIAKVNFNYDLKLYCSISSNNFEIYEIYKKYFTKFISTKDFIKYIISQLPVLQDTECDNVCDMLKSQDRATVSTALGTLQYYNFFNQGVDILGALMSSKCYDLPDNREAEYIYYLLGVTKSKIVDSRHYRLKEKIRFLMEVLNKFIIVPSMNTREKVITILRQNLFDQICKDYKDELEILDLTLNLEPNDKNGETDVSSSEVEGEKV